MDFDLLHALHAYDAKAMVSPQQQIQNSHLHAFGTKPVGRPQPACEEFTIACKANGRGPNSLFRIHTYMLLMQS